MTPDFTFAIKGNRYITHIKRLKDREESIAKFFESANSLMSSDYRIKSGSLKAVVGKHVILWQLPPSFKKDIKKLETFLELLPDNFRHAFEFRHKSWTSDVFEDLFHSLRIETSVVLQDWREWPIYKEPIGNFIYIRFHGREQLYTSGYSKEELAQWAEKVQKWVISGLDVYAYFNNDALGYAPENARKLSELLI